MMKNPYIFVAALLLSSCAHAQICDIDDDGRCGLDDLRVLYDDIAIAAIGGPSDADGNGLVNNNDIGAWLADAGAFNGTTYYAGDSDLREGVRGSDTEYVYINFGKPGMKYWDDGNFNGNAGGVFDVGGRDFTLLAFNFGKGMQGSESATALVVPEPNCWSFILLSMMFIGCRRRSHTA